MELITGPIDMTLPVDKAGRQITGNVYRQPPTTVQCVPGADAKPTPSKWTFDCNIVAVEGHTGVQGFDPLFMQY